MTIDLHKLFDMFDGANAIYCIDTINIYGGYRLLLLLFCSICKALMFKFLFSLISHRSDMACNWETASQRISNNYISMRAEKETCHRNHCHSNLCLSFVCLSNSFDFLALKSLLKKCPHIESNTKRKIVSSLILVNWWAVIKHHLCVHTEKIKPESS